ncbi:protein disulfide-isomerase precursor [Dimargaris verticillata]|uniref:Protein disulfide-isomerase n=1 Tax=Dimargaris verticillata TaxID=2761393 RepID=A0A9W8AXR3_9FUNG|nr:protein disulfide-isomerase precursor [Dimargaris verticillata]
MKFGTARFALLGAVAASMLMHRAAADAPSADNSTAHSDVLDLTNSNFDSSLENAKLALVEFYAPWCGYCKALAPEYELAATQLKDENVPVAKVNCDEEKALCSKYGVQGFPTLKVLNEGTWSPYEGQRKSDAIVSYMKRQKMPAVAALTADNFDTFNDSEDVVVVGYFDSEDSSEYAKFKETAQALRNSHAFGAVVDKDLAKKHNKQAPAIVLYGKKASDEPYTLTDSDELASKEGIEKFIHVYSLPLLDDISGENYSKYVDAGLPLAFAFYLGEENRPAVVDLVTAAAEKVRGKISVVLTDANKYAAQATHLNLKEQWPTLGIQDLGGLKYPVDQAKDLTKAYVGEFFADYLAGKVEPSVKSEAVPESNDGPVKVVVANQFSELVMDKQKDVLIEFYAPWCGHCKKLAPIYEELGEKYTNDPTVVIAKMDATTNDIPVGGEDFKVTGFPTIKLVKRDTNEVVTYEGNRSLESFEDFLSQHVATSATEKVKEKAKDAGEAAKEKVEAIAEEINEKVADAESKVHEEL